jgi:type I restriction enzyme M protein
MCPRWLRRWLVSDARRLVDKLWSYCNVLRDDGVSTIEYTEQLTYLLFLKMAHERETRKLNPERIVPAHCSAAAARCRWG